ncbi:hypothetical protein ACFQY3_00495 [Paenibacillus farraposensis]|uniref:hypothetical protein n=1 Tax=Paenibacillus farraposensis TaxID=2807095 RepID=UPI00360EE5A6
MVISEGGVLNGTSQMIRTKETEPLSPANGSSEESLSRSGETDKGNSQAPLHSEAG